MGNLNWDLEAGRWRWQALLREAERERLARSLGVSWRRRLAQALWRWAEQLEPEVRVKEARHGG
ncbi:hypothetical protein [Thermus igniterrae]|jgi:hypothetical protein|uniref:hypothetical protein n=1 Tax=Thermus igniterrae TaxID=88189 RepID=UPI00035F240A|nr:hypothetical protein [Thermus igniterrae]